MNEYPTHRWNRKSDAQKRAHLTGHNLTVHSNPGKTRFRAMCNNVPMSGWKPTKERAETAGQAAYNALFRINATPIATLA